MKRIILTQDKVALISDQDYWLVKQLNWSVVRSRRGETYYAHARYGHTTILMHRLIAGLPPFDLDHKNGDGLDNRRSNLRPASPSENTGNSTTLRKNNTSGYKGVTFNHKRRLPWGAQITFQWQNYSIGWYETPEEAATAYGLYAVAAFGEFANPQ